MLEFLLILAKRVGVNYPDSGPGTKYLISGTPQYGYFGEVPDAEMGVVNQLIDAIPGDSGITVFQKSAKWLKWYHGGRVLFYPTSPIALTSYDVLTTAKATFNSAQAGTPNVPAVIPQYGGRPIWKDNLTVIASDGTYYRVRLFDFVKDSGVGSGSNFEATASEFIDIFSSVFRDDLTSSLGLKLNKSLLAALAVDYGNGGRFWAQETNSVGPSGLSFIGASSSGSFTRGSMIPSNTKLVGWIPVLERLTQAEVDSLLAAVSDLRATSTVPDKGGSLSFTFSDTVFPIVSMRSDLDVVPSLEIKLEPNSLPVYEFRSPSAIGPIAPSITYSE